MAAKRWSVANAREEMVPVLDDPGLTPAAWRLLAALSVSGGHPVRMPLPATRLRPQALGAAEAIQLLTRGLARDTERGLLITPLGKEHQVDRHRRHGLIREKPLYADDIDDRP